MTTEEMDAAATIELAMKGQALLALAVDKLGEKAAVLRALVDGEQIDAAISWHFGLLDTEGKP